MIDILKHFLNKTEARISKTPDDDRSYAIRIATCAILLEMANIDDEFTLSEKEYIISILKESYDLSDEDATELIHATEEEVKGSIDLWQFTNLINSNYSMKEKNQLIEAIWKVAYTDGKLEKHEDYLIHKLANLLHFTHKQLIDCKLKVLHGIEKR